MSENTERKRKPKGMRPDKRIQVTYTDGRRPAAGRQPEPDPFLWENQGGGRRKAR